MKHTNNLTHTPSHTLVTLFLCFSFTEFVFGAQNASKHAEMDMAS